MIPLSCNEGTDPERCIQALLANQFDEFHQVVIPLKIVLHILSVSNEHSFSHINRSTKVQKAAFVLNLGEYFVMHQTAIYTWP